MRNLTNYEFGDVVRTIRCTYGWEAVRNVRIDNNGSVIVTMQGGREFSAGNAHSVLAKSKDVIR